MFLCSLWSSPAEPHVRVAALLGLGPPSAWLWLGCGLVAFGRCHAELLLPRCSYRTTAAATPLLRDAAAPALCCGTAAADAVASPLHSHSLRLCTIVCPGPMPATAARTWPHSPSPCHLWRRSRTRTHISSDRWVHSTCMNIALMAQSASRQDENGQSSYLPPPLPSLPDDPACPIWHG
jgi:hypothetical protein